MIESDPAIGRFCERPGFIQFRGRRYLADYLVSYADRQELVLLPNPMIDEGAKQSAELSAASGYAGYGLYNPIEAVTEAQFDGLMGVHLKGPFFLTQTRLPLLREGAGIVNLTSATTRVATVGVAPYAMFKGGLEVLTRYMAKEFGDRRVRVNAVSPGAIRTELGGGLSVEFEAVLTSQTALGRVGESEDVARVIASLLTEDGGWINGQSIEVAGGYII